MSSKRQLIKLKTRLMIFLTNWSKNDKEKIYTIVFTLPNERNKHNRVYTDVVPNAIRIGRGYERKLFNFYAKLY